MSKQTFSTAQQTTSALKALINYILDEKEDITYILLRHIQSDPIEARFGWYRQLNGVNYFNSVLQFLQAEKTIRILALVKMGFKVTEVQEIFVEATAEVQSELLFEVDHIINATSDINLSEDFDLNEDDNPIVCYVAGALSRSLLKQFPTSRKTCCRELISRGTTLTLDAEDAGRSTVQNEEFISMVSMGIRHLRPRLSIL